MWITVNLNTMLKNRLFPLVELRRYIQVGVEVKNKITLKKGAIIELSYLRDYVMVAYGTDMENQRLENITNLVLIETEHE